MEDDWAPVEV
jgi:dynein heavy chain, axonemal